MNKNRKHKNRKFRINKTNKIMRQRHREKYHHIKGIKSWKNGKKRYISNKVVKLLDLKKFYHKIEKNENKSSFELIYKIDYSNTTNEIKQEFNLEELESTNKMAKLFNIIYNFLSHFYIYSIKWIIK